MKGTLASYTFEHMEIASYKMLISAAGEAGQTDVQRICEENLREEEAMAAWLGNNFRVVTTRFLRRDELDADSANR
jgi:ferritin-like metal-binding protein YciE